MIRRKLLQEEITMHFEIDELIQDLGGAAYVARRLNICRTIPYGWIRRDFISSTYLSQIKTVWPRLDLNKYFKTELMNGELKRSPRASGSRVGSDPDPVRNKATSS